MNIRTRIFFMIIFLLALAGGYLWGKTSDHDHGYAESRENLTTTQFTNPLLECDIGAEYISQSIVRPKRTDIEKYISQRKAAGDVSFVSVYYRDLNNGPWIGIDESEKFSPASLMKVPLMLAYYKEAEENPSILTKTLEPIPAPTTEYYAQHFPPQQQVEIGKVYTTEELLEHAVRYSDNYAAQTLFDALPHGIDPVLKDLYLTNPTDPESDFITVKDYATFFRVLFNASYLSRSHSEKALRLLSESTFDKGLRKYLPSDIKVANKFGEREYQTKTTIQFHDCGIIYYPKRPYLLCVMTRGTDVNKMTDTIAGISKIVYDSINKNR